MQRASEFRGRKIGLLAFACDRINGVWGLRPQRVQGRAMNFLRCLRLRCHAGEVAENFARQPYAFGDG